MSEHEEIKRLLPLASTGEIAPGDLRKVQEHLVHCESCRLLEGDYSALGNALHRLPTPQPGAELLARVRSLAAARLAQKQRRNRDAALLAPLVAASWIVAWASWPAVRAAASWLLTGWHLPSGSFSMALTVYSTLGFLPACVAAIAIGLHARASGRAQ